MEVVGGNLCRTVYALDQAGRSVYCNSPACVAELIRSGWRLADPSQLGVLVRALAVDPSPANHRPSDHF